MPVIDDAQRQEQRKKAGDFLKMADRLFKGGDFEGAAKLVQNAMATDPQNPYAIAYHERIKFAIEQRELEKQKAAEAPPPAPTPRKLHGAATRSGALRWSAVLPRPIPSATR